MITDTLNNQKKSYWFELIEKQRRLSVIVKDSRLLGVTIDKAAKYLLKSGYLQLAHESVRRLAEGWRLRVYPG